MNMFTTGLGIKLHKQLDKTNTFAIKELSLEIIPLFCPNIMTHALKF